MTSTPAVPVDSYASDRHFQVWHYQVGHSQLLLRSVKGTDHDSRIDVLFKAVHAIQLPTSFDGLTIDRHADAFALAGRDWTGSVVAGSCFQAEDDGEHYDPSPFEASF
jgi:hypothetical protein